MPFDVPKTAYSGKIREITLGSGPKAVTVGGESAYPFYLFEGAMPHLPRIAMEVYDSAPQDWPDAARQPFADVITDPAAWAKKCISEYGAELICLQLVGTDPNGEDRPAEEAVELVRKVAAAIDVPLIVWGTANHEKDAAVLKLSAETVKDKKLVLGPVEEGDYKQIVPAAIANGHTVAASSPIDINLAKQLNIQMGNLGVPDGSLIMDPTVSSIGYGIEYCYSVMERMRMAALTQQDGKLQFPIIANVARETWKAKESRQTDDPRMGDTSRRGILLEAMSAMVLLLAGADVLVMRHPDAVKLVGEMVADLAA